jgi:phage-related protein
MLSRNKLNAVFFKTSGGAEPVRDWLKLLTKADKQTIGNDIKTVQYGWPLGMPLVDYLNDGLWEVRVKLSGGRIARILFFMTEHTMVLVHAFMKKSKATLQHDLDIAKARKKQYLSYKEH